MLLARLTLAALAAHALAACTVGVDPDSDFESEDGEGDDGSADGVLLAPTWTTLGVGVAYQQVNTGHAILIVYGGYSAKINYSAALGSELVDAKLGALDVGRVYAVKGPQDPGYNAREIQNTKLRAHLRTIDDGTSPICVIGHSSGSFVAHELLSQLYNAGSADTLARISYYDLDGGGSGLDDNIVESLGKITFVYAHDPVAGLSQNSSAAKSLAAAYAPIAKLFEVRVSGTGCHTGAGWCLHDVLITHKPHNPSTYDLANDYTDFVNRPVTTEYF